VIDSQSVKTTESGGPRGYECGQEDQRAQAPHQHRYQRASGGRAGARGRYPGPQRCARSIGFAIRHLFPWLRQVFADGGYGGEKLQTALAGLGQWTLKIVKRSDQTEGFHVLPRRWVVERTFAWFGRNRRLAKDFETTITSSEAWLYLASVKLLTRRLARQYPQSMGAHSC
jgi:transposase